MKVFLIVIYLLLNQFKKNSPFQKLKLYYKFMSVLTKINNFQYFNLILIKLE